MWLLSPSSQRCNKKKKEGSEEKKKRRRLPCVATRKK